MNDDAQAKQRRAKRAAAERARRERLAKLQADKERRIDRIVEIMSSGAWIPNVTNRELAKLEGVALDTLEREAAEASRIVRRAIGQDPEVIRARLLSAIDHVRISARQATRRQYVKSWVTERRNGKTVTRPVMQAVDVPHRDFDAELRALELYARLCPDVVPRQEVGLSAPDGGPVQIEHGVVVLPAKEIVTAAVVGQLMPKPSNGSSNGSNGSGSNGGHGR